MNPLQIDCGPITNMKSNTGNELFRNKLEALIRYDFAQFACLIDLVADKADYDVELAGAMELLRSSFLRIWNDCEVLCNG